MIRNILITRAALMIMAVVSFSSMKAESILESSVEQSKIGFFCKIDGVNYQPKFVSGIHESLSNVILITGADGSTNQQVQIQVSHKIAPGTYTELNNIGADAFVWMFYSPPFSEDAGDDGFAQTGTLTILENNSTTKRIRGTFSFVTTPSFNAETVWNISEGTFDVKYQ